MFTKTAVGSTDAGGADDRLPALDGLRACACKT
jgi:hypothetical protein